MTESVREKKVYIYFTYVYLSSLNLYIIILDNPIAQKLLYKQLTRLGFQVDCTNNGLEAVEAWTSHPPGYYKMGFFDHHMPKVCIVIQ